MSKNNWNLCLLPVAAIVAPAATSTFLLPSFAYAADYLTAAQAQTQLFPTAKTFVEKPLRFSAADRDNIKNASGLRQRWEQQKIWRAERDDELLGWFIVDDVIGKHEFITYGIAIAPGGKVQGIEILSYRETHGGQIRDAQWRKQFVGKKLGDAFSIDEDVTNISGATLSCRNVLNGVKRLLTIHKLFLAHD